MRTLTKLEVLPDIPTDMDSASIETVVISQSFSSAIEIRSDQISISISNDVDPRLLSQIIRCMT